MGDEFSGQQKPARRRVDARERRRRIEDRELPGSAGEDERSTSELPPAQAGDAPTPPKRRVQDAQRFPALPDEQPRRRRHSAARPPERRRFGWRDAIALLFLLAGCGLAGYFALIWVDPYSSLNPLAPPLLPPLVVSETPLPPPTATETPRPTARPTATFTPIPIDQLVSGAPVELSEGTPDLTATLLAGTPSATPPPPPFTLLRGRALYIANATSEGCNYSGIAGSVVDLNGQPLNGYTVWLTGEDLDTRLISGSSNLYGAGGFLVQVGTVAQERPYAAQLLAPDGVTPLSEPFTFLTRALCENNVVLIRFVQTRELP
jgi:hypothetical protein